MSVLLLQVNGVDMMGRSQEELVAMLRSTRQGESVNVVVARQEDLFLPRELVRPLFFWIVSTLPQPLVLVPPSVNPDTSCYFLTLPVCAARLCQHRKSPAAGGNVPALV